MKLNPKQLIENPMNNNKKVLSLKETMKMSSVCKSYSKKV